MKREQQLRLDYERWVLALLMERAERLGKERAQAEEVSAWNERAISERVPRAINLRAMPFCVTGEL